MMKRKFVNPVRLWVALAGVLAAKAVMAAPTGWVYEAVDPERTAGEHAAALDAQDYAHVVYGRDALYYDWEDGDGWHSETVDKTVAPAGIAIVLDDTGGPHVVYVDLLNYYVKYARRDSVGWSVETIAQDAYVDMEPGLEEGLAAICLDSAGQPHVGYRAGSWQEVLLKHLSKDGSGWHTSTVGSWSGAHLSRLAIGVADDNQPHLGWVTIWSDTSYSAFHGWRDGTGWQSAEFPFSAGSRVGISQPQFDATGRLHLAYEDDDDVGWEGVVYLTGLAGDFHPEQLAAGRTETWRFGGASIQISQAGVPHVVFDLMHDATGLEHWAKIDGVWRQTVVEPTRTYGFTLALDASGRPYVLYRLIDGTMKSAWPEAEGWHTEVELSWPTNASWPVYEGEGQVQLLLTEETQPRLAWSRGGFGTAFCAQDEDGWHERVLAQPDLKGIRQIRLALDTQGNPHIAYNGLNEIGFRYACRDATGWHATPLEEADEWGDYRQSDLALDSEGHPHIGYLSTDRCLRYAVLTETGWESTAVGTSRIDQLALALDGMQRPHFLVKESTDPAPMVHVWQQDDGWHRETVALCAPGTAVEAWPGIVVDDAGGLHISYLDEAPDGSSEVLKYGHRTAPGWELTTVGTAPSILCSGLAVDSQNGLHIAYSTVVPGSGFLRYARKDSTGWETSTVTSEHYIPHLSLCLAPDGTPHICYTKAPSPTPWDPMVFRYAWLGDTGWESMTLENGWATTSLAVDSEGRPHVAYCNSEGRRNLSYLRPSTILDRFTWNAIPSPQESGVSFPVTLTARNAAGDIYTEFTNSVTLSGCAPGIATTNLVIGTGANSWGYPLYSRYHDTRTQVIYPASELGRACTLNSLALEVTTPPGQTLENWTIRMQHTSLAEYPVSGEWESAGWTIVYQGNEPQGTTGWRTFEFSTTFDYNGTNNLLVDFSFNNDFYSSEGLCQSTDVGAYRSITYASDSKDGDPLSWSGTSPTPVRIQTVPNVVLGTSYPDLLPVSLSPTVTTPFVNGVWTGTVTVQEAVTNLVLRADDGLGHDGESNPFDVQGVAQPPLILTDDGQFGITNGCFGFNVQGQVGQVMVIEVSTNLLDWLPLQTNVLGGKPVYFSDPGTTNFTQRFYRAVTPR